MAPHKPGHTIDMLPTIGMCALYSIYMLRGIAKEF